MTRALCTRSSKRRPAKSSQEVVPEDCKENSPSILSQSSRSIKRLPEKNVCKVSEKQTIVNKGVSHPLKSASSNANKNCCSPIRKSVRRLKSPFTDLSKSVDIDCKKNVLCDKTNSPNILQTKPNEYDGINENKKPVLHKLLTVPKLNVNNPHDNITDKENHVPIYKTASSLNMFLGNELPQNMKKEAVYEFEVDENEDPVHKKRRKKRAYIKKGKIGPKALTINNIKYSSSESLVSLPERSAPQRKKNIQKSNVNLKQYSSVTNLNESEDTCSVKSFMSHPPSLRLCKNKTLNSKVELSVLQETQSEICQSPTPNVKEQIPTELSRCHYTTSINLSNNPTILKYDSQTTSHNVHFSPDPRCYPSKTRHSNSSKLEHGPLCQSIADNSVAHQTSSCSINISAASAREFLSSTPCKQISTIVCNNSVFDDSCGLKQGLRPSTGFSKNVSGETKILNEDCFGFDEPEELEEPLVSPIKNNINLQPRKAIKMFYQETQPLVKHLPKPSPQDVIEMLKASIPKVTYKESTEVFDNSSLENSPSPPNTHGHGPAVHFKKPPRRSYERQRRVRHYSDHEEEESEKSDLEEKEEDKKKIVKNCYKKINKTKSSKPSKAKQKSVKEEQEMERLAALMNAKFQEIEKVNLVVE